MIEYDSIKKAMGVDIAISPKMAQAMYKWQHMYVNEAPWLNKEVKSLNLPAAICTEMARLVTMESSVTINGSARADLIAESMQPFLNQLQNYTEYACSVGGIVFKPYISGGKIAIDVTQAGSFYPVTFDSANDITAVVFPEFKQSGKNLYVRLEYQAFDGDTYTIINKAFVSKKMIVRMDEIINLGQEISLEDVDEWADIEPFVQLRNATTPLFSYFRMPMANNTDPLSPLGVSVFSRAVDLIRDADEQYGATLWEYRSKETAIQAADEFYQKDRKGHIILPAGNKRLYRALGPGVSDKDGAPFFNVYSPEIRDQSFFNGYNRIVQKIEFNSGLAYGTLSDPQTVDKTAEEIISSKQRSYGTVKAIQNSLAHAIEKLVDAIDAWMTIADVAPAGNVQVSSDWDDSLIVDKKREIEQLRADLSAGIVGRVEYRMKRFNETREQAIKMLREADEYDLEKENFDDNDEL